MCECSPPPHTCQQTILQVFELFRKCLKYDHAISVEFLFVFHLEVRLGCFHLFKGICVALSAKLVFVFHPFLCHDFDLFTTYIWMPDHVALIAQNYQK